MAGIAVSTKEKRISPGDFPHCLVKGILAAVCVSVTPLAVEFTRKPLSRVYSGENGAFCAGKLTSLTGQKC